MSAQIESAAPVFIDRIGQREAGACRLVTLGVPVESVVTFRGSFLSYPDFASGDELLQELTVMLLDRGTRKRDRFEIAEVLDQGGSQLRFNSDGLRVRFSGRALKEHVGEVLRLAAEQLAEPLFDEAEVAKAKAQLAAALKRSLESTSAQAAGALSRRLYHPAHPNFTRDAREDLTRLEGFTVDDVRAYHRAHFGTSGLTLVAVGDLDAPALTADAEESLGAWAAEQQAAAFATEPASEPPGRVVVSMPDKSNIDVRMGHAVDVRRKDADYLPLYLAVYILGGNFSARLMATVRDEMGLTYGISSNLSGITTAHAGHWNVGVTLSTENVEKGMEATLAQARRFVEGGITQEELDEKKTTLTGSFKVGLGTTGGLAGALLTSIEQDLGLDYLDRYRAEVEAVTLEHVNEAIRRHLKPDGLHFALAGTL